MTELEIEKQRLEELSRLAPDERDPAQFAPGGFGCHEALHTASVLWETVDRHLLNHPSVLLDPEFFKLAFEAHGALFELYQAIGAKHLSDEV